MSTAEYYKFDIAQLPDDLYHPHIPVEKWLDTATTAGEKGFPASSLNVKAKIPLDVELERIICIALYMVGHVIPFVLPGLCILAYFSPLAKTILWFVLGYVGILYVLENFIFRPWFLKKYKHPHHVVAAAAPSTAGGSMSSVMTDNTFKNQFVFTERNTTKYLSVNYVWPKSMHRPKMQSTPLIFCVVPHGVAPIGITAYPLWSRLWNDKLCHWCGAPVLFQIPIISYFLKQIGYIPAKSKNIYETLTKKEENVGLVLDGIAGMFQPHNEETAYLKSRKGIVKIALRSGCPIVPVYGFGHTKLWTVVVDPFGALKALSTMMEASLTPFFGRFGWFLGPPRRIPVTVCLGEPVVCPKIDEPTKEQIDEYHQKLLESYKQLFDKHKAAYGWADKELRIV